MKVWECKIGDADGKEDLPAGADSPMRRAIEEAYLKITGRYPDFIFSGWGGDLDPIQKSIVRNGFKSSLDTDAAEVVTVRNKIVKK